MAEEKQLREIVAQQFTVFEDGDASDEDCREACSVVLEAMGSFLARSEKRPSSTGIPFEFLRTATSRIIREIGPGDTLFRTQWLRILRPTRLHGFSLEALHFVLEFLPLTLLPVHNDEEETSNGSIQQNVMKVLESIIKQNNHAATATFQCLNRLVVTNRIRRQEAFSFFLHHLHVSDKGTAFKCLFDHAKESVDWVLAVETVRRLAADDPGISFTSSVVGILFRLQREGNHPTFFEEYLAILDDETHTGIQVAGGDATKQTKPASLTTLDLVLLLFHRKDDDEDHSPSIESMLDEMITMELIHSEILSSLTTVITTHLQDCWDDLIWLLLLLCSSPLRNPQLVPMTQTLALAKEFGVDCFAKSDTEGKERILIAFVQVLEESLDYWTGPLREEEPQSSGNAARSMLPLVVSSLLDILVPAAELSPGIFPQHHRTLLRLLHCQELGRESVQAICKLLVLMDNHSKVNTSMNIMHPPANLLVIVRNLLFPDPLVDNGPSPRNGDCSAAMCARGLILISEIFASSALDKDNMALLCEFVRRALLPPTNRLVNPRIGIEGVRTIRSIHICAIKKDRDVPIASLFNPGIFPTMTTILMKTRLVKYSDSQKATNSKVGVLLAYSNKPSCFKENCNKQRKFHKMIFSFDALLNETQFSSTSAWEASFRWTFDLIDTYLTLGRDKSKGKWIPHAWVEALLEFRSTDLSSSLRVANARQQRTMDILERALNDFDICFTESMSSMGSLHRDFVEMLKQTKKKSHRTILAKTLLRCAQSHFLGLAMSLAILGNTHTHYQDVFHSHCTETDPQSRLEATRLLQFQLAKIYDLLKKCEVMEVIFRGITNTSLRGKKRRSGGNGGGVPLAGSLFETMDPHANIQKAGEQLKSIISCTTSTQNYLQTKILWFCLVDPTHDTTLIKMIQNESSSPATTSTSDNDGDVVINMRLNILRHLIGYLQHFSTFTQRTKPGKVSPIALLQELADMQPFFAQCVRLAAFLSSKMRVLASGVLAEKRSKQLMTLTAGYFRLLLVSMEISLCFHGDVGTTTGSSLVEFRRFWSVYQCVMDSESPLTEAIVVVEAPKPPFKSILNGFLKHLLVCTDAALATELLETLSILSFGGECHDSFTEMVRVTWTALHSKFTRMEPSFTSHVPFAFVEALKRRSPGSLGATRRTARDVAVRETLLKAALNKSKMMEKHFFLLDGMLRHWGFLVLAEEVTPVTADHLHQLYTNIHTFLSQVNDVALPKKSQAKLDDSSDDDADYVPPNPVRVSRPELPESPIPGLDSKNFFTYFQILLDMTVSSAALFTIKAGSQWIDPQHGPFRELCKLVETFGYLVNLYRKRIHIFPQTMLPSVLNTCRSMLNVVHFQSTQCIEWRSSQPALTAEQIEADVFDPASLQFLGRILDIFGIHVVGCLTALCDTIETLCSPALEKHRGAMFGPAQNQRVKGLRLKIGKVSSILDKIAETHSLPAPTQTSIDTLAKGEPARKRRRIEIKGFLQFEESAGESEDTTRIQSSMPSNSTDAGVPELNNDEGRTLSSELTWDEDESEDSFGADGDWGRESDEAS